jgi:hypothetical protein
VSEASYRKAKSPIFLEAPALAVHTHPAGKCPIQWGWLFYRDAILFYQDVSANSAAPILTKGLCGLILPWPHWGQPVISIPVRRRKITDTEAMKWIENLYG